MNFFEHQEQARKSTRWLLFLFLLSVITLIALTDLFVLFLVVILEAESYSSIAEVPSSLHAVVAGSVLLVIFFASLYRTSTLSGGGRQVAEEMGARLVVPSTTNLNERRLINIVEEIAIASGSPIPQVYLMNDSAINAFAAGYTPHDAVIAVTTGTIEMLSREELQGVVAHEFSHILNGDMRLNLRLMGFLYGILFIALIGQKIIRVSSRSRDGAKFAFFGIGLVVIGYGGLFFGNLIKATISRQREYLADASAVQFTRNPEGIGGALKKIGGWPSGSRLVGSNVEEYSHFYFSSGIRPSFFSLFSTHPPLKDRIKRVEPSWDGRFVKPKIKKQPKKVQKDKPFGASLFKAGSFKDPVSLITTAAIIKAISATAVPTSDHVQYAKKLISEIPEPLLVASRDPFGAYALVLGLLMNRQLLTSMSAQDKALEGVDREIRQQFRQLLASLISFDIKYRLPLIELAILSLKDLSPQQLKKFSQHMINIIKHDGRVEVWEWALHYWIINLSLGKPTIPKSKYSDFSRLKPESNILLSAVVYTNDPGLEVSKQIYDDAKAALGIPFEMVSKDEITSDSLIKAIGKMRELRPLIKPNLLKALCLVAQHDGVLEAKEVELIRTVAEGIDCPMPPVLDVQ